MGHRERQEDRYNVGLAAQLREDARKPRAVKVTNVSARGCRFSAPDLLFEAGAVLTMSFGRAGSRDARVKWREGNSFGVRFRQPLEAVSLDHIRLFLSEEPALVAERDGLSPAA